ncbi:hypothetical protein [Clostridium sp.]
MKYKKSITTLVLIIFILATLASAYGIFSRGSSNKKEVLTISGQTVKLYAKGLYKNDSVSCGSQAVGQDIVTLIIGLPLLLISLVIYRKNLLKGKLLLAGILGYFLYTYTSYSFLVMYNNFFLIYVMLMSLSFYAFTLTMMSFDLETISPCFSLKLPVKLIGGLLIFMSIAVCMMWLGIILPALKQGITPKMLDQYTTLTIQAMDIGFVVPTNILASILLIKRKPFGYLLASVMIVKEVTLVTAIIAMIIGQIYSGVYVPLMQSLMFPIFNLLLIYFIILIMRNVDEKIYKENSRLLT